MKLRKIFVLLVLLPQFAIPASSVAEVGSISEAKSEFDSERIEIVRNAMELGREETAKRLNDLFETSFAGILDDLKVSELSAEDLHTLFLSLNSFVHSTFQRDESELMTSVIIGLYDHPDSGEMDLPEDPSPAQRAYDTLINARHHDLATRLKNELNQAIDALPYSFPKTSDAEELPQVYEMSESPDIGVKDIDLEHGEWLISVVHPSCAFSRRAMEYIESHSNELSDLMPENVLWVSGQSFTYTLPWIERWNAKSETIDIHVSANDEAWPDYLMLRATPVFYVLRDGDLAGQMIGWAGESKEKDLRELLSDETSR